MGLGCLLSLCVASRAWADGEQTAGKAVEGERPAPQRISGAVTNAPAETARTLVPPYMRDVRGDVTTTALFPFYFERKSAEGFQRLVTPYFYQRGPKLNVDVALGVVWSLRGKERNTFVLPPLYTHRNGKSWGLGLLPLFSTGVFKGHHHTLIPPLLTWIDGDQKRRHTLIGPYFDWRKEQSRFWGLFPLLWSKSDDVDRFTMIPPVFFRWADDDPLSYTTVVPPFYHKRRKDERGWGLFPLVFHNSTPELKRLTIPFLLFQHAKGPKQFRLVTPLLAHTSDATGRGWYTWLYQRKRGDTGFDSVAPFFFRTWDTRDNSSSLVLAPIYWHFRDPANDTRAVLPFMARSYHDGIGKTWLTPLVGHYESFERDEQTWWVAPTFHYAWTETSRQFNIHPLFYWKVADEKKHLAVAPLYYDFRNHVKKTHRFALFPLYWNFKNFDKRTFGKVAFPLYWDFANEKKHRRRIVGFPLWWDFHNDLEKRRTSFAFPLYLRLERGDRVGHGVLNTYFERNSDPANKSWKLHFFPLLNMSRGERGNERDKAWNLFYGLAGYERRGAHRRIKAFWIPFNLGK